MEPLQAGDPRQVGAYRLTRRLGGGGMGQVYLGASPGGRPVAVKVIRAEFAADDEFRRRFAREVEAARRIGGFHTAPVVDADPYGDPAWMVTAYIAGPSLQAVVEGAGPLEAGGVLQLGAALAEGLAAIHGSGLVHRDLKPSNIIMADDGPRIIDFGIALPAGATALTEPGKVVGTLSFMSPEQVRADSVTPASDVFALGSVLAYAATGRAPFDAPSAAAVMYRVINEPPHLGGLTAGSLRDALTDCLAKEPDRRPPLSALLARFAAQVPDGAPGAAAPEPARPVTAAPRQAPGPGRAQEAPAGIWRPEPAEIQGELRISKIASCHFSEMMPGYQGTVEKIAKLPAPDGTFVVNDGALLTTIRAYIDQAGVLQWNSRESARRPGTRVRAVGAGTATAWSKGTSVWVRPDGEDDVAELRIPGLHDHDPRLALLAGGRKLAFADKSQIRVYDTASGETCAVAEMPNAFTNYGLDRMWGTQDGLLVTSKYASQMVWDDDLRVVTSLDEVGLVGHYVADANAVDPTGRYFAACAMRDHIAVVDITRNSLRANLPLPGGGSGGHPADLVFHPEFANVAIAVQQGAIICCNTLSMRVSVLAAEKVTWTACFFAGPQLLATVDDQLQCVTWKVTFDAQLPAAPPVASAAEQTAPATWTQTVTRRRGLRGGAPAK